MLNFLAQIPLNAERLPATSSTGWFGLIFTNSLIVAAIVAVIVLIFARRATATMQLVPKSGGSQNLFEAVIEALYEMLEGIVGRHMVAKVFPLLATLFLFILVSNWFGLLPGVGTVGFGYRPWGAALAPGRGGMSPLLRPANADLNLTLGMALVFTVFWVIWSFQELGVGAVYLATSSVPRAECAGFLKYPLIGIFIFVGVIEVISIAFRPVSLSLRLFGNIYAGENLMHTMSELGETMGMPTAVAYLMKIIVPIPFYFLELLVGVVQALVFTLLCAVYIKLTTSHEEGAHGDAHGHAPDTHAAGLPAGHTVTAH